jgi:hypothetical protein
LADLKVVNANGLGFALDLPLPPNILEIAHQLLLLGVHRNHRFPLLEIPLRLAVDEFKLLIPIRMLAPLQPLLIRLQTVIQVMEQFCHGLIAYRMAFTLQFFC